MRDLRILFLSHSPNNPDGGASRIYHMLTNSLKNKGHLVSTYHLEDIGIPSNRHLSRLVQRIAMPEVLSRFALRLDLNKFDIIMSSSGMAGPLFRKLAPSQDRPQLVNHLHGLTIYDHLANVTEHKLGHIKTSLVYNTISAPQQIRWDLDGIRSADLNIVQNLRDLSWVSEKLSSGGQVKRISAAIHPDLLAASQNLLTTTERDPKSIIWFASWEARKGSYYVPGAFRLIRNEIPDAKLFIGGTGKSEDVIHSAFAQEDRPHVNVLKRIPIDEQIKLFVRGSVFLFPSLSEGFGLALLEAICLGLVPVTTNTAFGGDELTDGVNARIIPPSTEHIARAVIDLIRDKGTRTRMSVAGRELSHHFTINRMESAYEKAFIDLHNRNKNNNK